MKIHNYKNYNQYREKQIMANKHKIDWVWAWEGTVVSIIRHYTRLVREPTSVLCHGSRNGAEVKYFQKHLPEATVLGTDISPTATNYLDQVVWDFQIRNNDWVGKWDIVYSNSFDHSNKPEETLTIWKEQITKDGIVAVDYSVWPDHTNQKPNSVDCLHITFDELEKLFDKVGLVPIITKEVTYTKEQNPADISTKFYLLRRK